jgi:hypothetical protein
VGKLDDLIPKGIGQPIPVYLPHLEIFSSEEITRRRCLRIPCFCLSKPWQPLLRVGNQFGNIRNLQSQTGTQNTSVEAEPMERGPPEVLGIC